jgi:Virulence factor membrane-bound polymerase, C-terminal/O-Antigen ligase
MHVFLSLAVALSLSWFGQLPPHGEFERDWLAFYLLSLVVLVAGIRALRRREHGASANMRLNPGLSAFLALWAGLMLVVAVQSITMPQAAWGGRNFLAVCWLVGALVCTALGALAYDRCAATEGLAQKSMSAWVAVAAGIILAALFNAAVAWIQVLPLPQLQVLFPAPLEPGRGYGALLQPNLTATLLVLGMVSAVSITGVVMPSGWRMYVACGGMLLLGSGTAVTGSRVGMLMLVLLVLYTLSQRLLMRWDVLRPAGRSNAVQMVLFAATGFALTVLAAQLHWVEFATPLARGAAMSNGRVLIFANAWQMGLAFPVAGAGFGQFAFWHVELPYLPKMPGYLTHAHNLPLQLWAELGGLGLLWLVLVLGVLTQPLWPFLRGQRVAFTGGQRWALALIVFLLIHSMTEMPLWSASFLILFAFATGLWLYDPDTQRGLSLALPVLAKYGTVVGIVALALSIWVYRDYLKVAALYEGARGAPVARVEAMPRAFTSIFFHPAAEFAAANSAQVTLQTAPAYSKTLPYLWRYVTDPRMFEWQLRTAAWERNAPVFEHYAQRFAHMYPAEYAAFKAVVSVEKSGSPWAEFQIVWP